MSENKKNTNGKVLSPREAAAAKVASRTREAEKSAVIYETRRAYPLFCCILMWCGFAIGLLSWLPNFTFLGINNASLGIPGGVLALVGVFLMMGTIKCPACGAKKLGRGMGAKVPRSCECPECHAKVNIK
ncbi:MAG: hypothetical protein MJ075_01855 [Oscillospiraceae bacterium]|nr:hypothetical protein [Oscillospiraceae bacterium]